MAMVEPPRKQYKRIDELARPKPLPAGFIEDKRSVYHESKIVKSNHQQPTKFILTDRLDQLCQPKPYHYDFAQDRPSPKWPVTPAAQKAAATSVVESLSKPKAIHRDWVEGRPVQTVVKTSAKSANASERLIQLSLPKKGAVNVVKEEPETPHNEVISKINPAALKAVATSRIEVLAQEKQTHQSYQPPCPVQSIVNPKTMKAKASAHIIQLARPKDRKELEENPNVWKVTAGAKAAQASQRINELAAPLPRKVRAKKAAATPT